MTQGQTYTSVASLTSEINVLGQGMNTSVCTIFTERESVPLISDRFFRHEELSGLVTPKGRHTILLDQPKDP
jgi:hypothetical protein